MDIFPRKSMIFMMQFAHFFMFYYNFTVFNGISKSFCINSQSHIICSPTSDTPNLIKTGPKMAKMGFWGRLGEQGGWGAQIKKIKMDLRFALHSLRQHQISSKLDQNLAKLVTWGRLQGKRQVVWVVRLVLGSVKKKKLDLSFADHL